MSAPGSMPAIGAPAPWFKAEALAGNPSYAFDTAAGRWIVLLFLGSGAQPAAGAALDMLAHHRTMFDDDRAAFFGVTIDPGDADAGRIAQRLPGIRWFIDRDRAVSGLYGAIAAEGESLRYTPHWLLLDPMLRVRRRAPLGEGGVIFADLAARLAAPPESATAPVLVVPDILPPDLCRHLIGLYERHGGTDSGFMREQGGITRALIDHGHKRRSDYNIGDAALIEHLKTRLATALVPMIARAFQFHASRIERFIVARYDGEEGGHFRPHRDNTTKGTAHRRFACTINLNAGDYEGGDLVFPEFGQRTYRAPTGGAVVFSCSLLHEASAVTRGQRYAFLPFLYDDEGARVREANLPFVAPDLQAYRSGLTS